MKLKKSTVCLVLFLCLGITYADQALKDAQQDAYIKMRDIVELNSPEISADDLVGTWLAKDINKANVVITKINDQQVAYVFKNKFLNNMEIVGDFKISGKKLVSAPRYDIETVVKAIRSLPQEDLEYFYPSMFLSDIEAEEKGMYFYSATEDLDANELKKGILNLETIDSSVACGNSCTFSLRYKKVK